MVERLPTQEEEDQFYAALGRAITDWANLESELSKLRLRLLGSTRDRAAIVFYRTPSIDSRVTLTSDLVHSFFPSHPPGAQPHPSLKEWKQLQADIKDNLPVRNRLAHHPAAPVVDLYESVDGTERKIEVRHASYMSDAEALRRREKTFEALGVEEISAHMKTLSSLINRLRNFRDGHFPPPPPTLAG